MTRAVGNQLFSKRLNNGFTLIELLVCIAIIGLLVSLLAPAIHAARDAGRRVSCQNNLRQMGLALHSFHDSHHAFPAAGWTRSSKVNPHGKYIGWQAVTLPFLEQQNTLNLVDRRFDWWEQTNLSVGSVQLPIYRCPSTPNSKPMLSLVAKPPRPALQLESPLGQSDYAALMGVRSTINPTIYSNIEATRAVLFRNSSTRFADILDGTSQSIMVTECGARPSVYRQRLLRTDLSNEQGNGWIDSEGGFSLDGSSLDGSQQGQGPSINSRAINATNENEPFSFHAGGAFFLFADAHVTFLSESIDLKILAALTTKNCGEIQAGE
jgi:prepilin-type N-terminal cleavage/methylation domain-containing protein